MGFDEKFINIKYVFIGSICPLMKTIFYNFELSRLWGQPDNNKVLRHPARTEEYLRELFLWRCNTTPPLSIKDV